MLRLRVFRLTRVPAIGHRTWKLQSHHEVQYETVHVVFSSCAL